MTEKELHTVQTSVKGIELELNSILIALQDSRLEDALKYHRTAENILGKLKNQLEWIAIFK